ncbi:RNA methyltransferase, partial [Lactobacillus sp. XV13L]|nr:RNA methyltransferase [Lactobacillus sp. XV13L]
TCTFAPEENEQNMNWLAHQFNFQILPLPHHAGMDTGRPQWGDNNPALINAVRLFPQHYHGEGHFICALQKPGSTLVEQNTAPLMTAPKLPHVQLWQEFLNATLQKVNFSYLTLQKDILYNAVFPINQQLNHLKVMRNGLRLGEFKKNRFVPNHALALALKPQQFQQLIDLDENQFKHFIHGEALILDQP